MNRKLPFGRIEPLEARQVMHVEVLAPLADVTAAPGASPATISLAGLFDDHHVTGTIVRFDVNAPAPNDKVYVELFDQPGENRLRATPATVANFLSYVDGGHYQNTFIHRSVPGFVVQGGGFTVSGSPINIGNVTQFAPVVNEPKPSGTAAPNNIRGTIAMAKLGSDPNSATNQWFFNLADNSANLDNQNGGFTVFGRVLGGGMAAVDAMAAVPRFGYASPFDTVPLRNVPGANPSTDPNFTNSAVDVDTLSAEQFVRFPQIVRVGELVYTVSTSAPALVTPTIHSDGSLKLSYGPGALGTGTVTVRATSVYDATSFAEDTFHVSVIAATGPQPNALIGLSGDELVISRGSGGTLTTAASVPLPAGQTWVNSVAGDFDGDGFTDTATQTSTGAWYVTRTTATGTAAPTPWAYLSIYQFPTVGDFNGDGKDDIAVRNQNNGAWQVLTSSGTNFNPSRFGRSNNTLTWSNVFAADFNGDGRSDVAVRNPANGFWRMLSSTGVGFNSARAGEWPTANAWNRAFAVRA